MKLERYEAIPTYGGFHYPRIHTAMKIVSLDVCQCGDKQRGPKGGVCGNCGNAIPTDAELERLNQSNS